MASDTDVPEITALPRGRARSGAMHSDLDEELNADMAILHASLEGKEPPAAALAVASGRRSASGEAAAAARAAAGGKPTLSKKTINVLTRLDVATAPPEELAGDVSAGSGKHVETAEEAEERELAEREKRRRAAEAGTGGVGGGGVGGGGGATAAAAAGSGGAGGAGTAAPTAVVPGPVPGVRAVKGSDKEFDVSIKLLLLGDSGVGKTSLLLRYSENRFDSTVLSTAGVDYKVQMLDMEGRRVKCQVWDTAGQQRFHQITHTYYKSAHGIVLVYDVSDATEASFHNVKYWMENITKHASSHVLRILVGNKSDVKGKKVSCSTCRALHPLPHSPPPSAPARVDASRCPQMRGVRWRRATA